MRQRITRFLEHPSFPDEETTRHAELLNLILLGSPLVSSLAIFLRPFEAGTLWLPAFIVTSRLLQIPLRRGQVNLAGWVHVSLMWLILSHFPLESGRVDSSALAGYILIVLIAALTLDRSAALLLLLLERDCKQYGRPPAGPPGAPASTGQARCCLSREYHSCGHGLAGDRVCPQTDLGFARRGSAGSARTAANWGEAAPADPIPGPTTKPLFH